MLDRVKGDIAHPARAIDINRLPLADIIGLPVGGIRIGAMVCNSEAAPMALP